MPKDKLGESRFIVGIDLGTTNSAVAYVDSARGEDAKPEPFAVPQLVGPGEVQNRPVLPSFLYLPASGLFPKGALALPWTSGPDPGFAVGELARAQGWQVPARLVSSAKSWLCHAGVDRGARILPWQAPAEIEKVSPVEASARYLEHVRDAWNHSFALADEGARLERQDVLITVPASFDAVARELTVRAAAQAGIERPTLLEEPQAAFYSWLAASGNRWRQQLRVGDVVLVCDIGGGTTDFSLIAVGESGGNLELERIAVGEHILLGGDNMDLALAQAVRSRLEGEGRKLDGWQLASLVHSCRHAKEQLLAGSSLPGPGEAAPVLVLGRGTKVVGGAIRSELTRAQVEEHLLEGFFPPAALDAHPRRERRAGLRELGLPFASDPAVTRHLAAFIAAHRPATAVLFNGGVMKGRPLRQRIVDALGSWSGSAAGVKVLEGTDLDLAVAHGAAYYGLVRRGRGVRIRGGTARAYYIGIESSMPAVPGLAPPLKALCVAPFGMEEGSEAEVAEREFGLVVGEPVEFRFLSSTTRRQDQVGALLEEVDESIQELAPVSTALGGRAGVTAVSEAADPSVGNDGGEDAGGAGQLVPVRLHSKVTELGTLELWCVSLDGDRRWKLEYNLRELQQP